MVKRGNSEGTIAKRTDGRWMARVTTPDGKRRAYYGKTQAEVLGKLNAVRKKIAEGQPLSSERRTVGAYLADWLEMSVKATVRPNTYKSYSLLVGKHIFPGLGHVTLARLTPQHVQRFLNEKHASGLSPRTVQYLHAVIRRALGQAEQWGLVSRNVAKLVSPPRVPKAEVHPLTPAEVKRLLTTVQEDRLSALYTVAVAVGLRQGEMLGLRWSDVNLEASTLTVRTSLQWHDGYPQFTEPKTAKSRRTVRLPDACIQALHAHRGRQTLERDYVGTAWRNKENLVFVREDGSPLTRSVVTHRFWRILKAAGIPKRRFHDLRHTCATLLLAQGVTLKVIQELLGHSLMSTTADIYATVLPVLMTDAADKMDAVLSGP